MNITYKILPATVKDIFDGVFQHKNVPFVIIADSLSTKVFGKM